MANSYGPKGIVTDGLVFSADAGNAQCYIGTGTTAYDIIENVALTLTNHTSINPTNGGVWEMDGTDDHINCDGGGVRNPNSVVTICQWVNFDTLGNYDGIFGKRIGTGTIMPFILTLYNNSKIRFRIAQSDSIAKNILSNSALSTGVWYHVVGVADGTNVKIYLDGVLQTDTTTYDGTLKQDATEDLTIGWNYTTELDGKAGPSQMYNRALSVAEILQNYNATKGRFAS
jgi:hypothetical protein